MTTYYDPPFAIKWAKKWGAPGVKMETDGQIWGRYEWNHDGRVREKWGDTLGVAETEQEASKLVADHLRGEQHG